MGCCGSARCPGIRTGGTQPLALPVEDCLFGQEIVQAQKLIGTHQPKTKLRQLLREKERLIRLATLGAYRRESVRKQGGQPNSHTSQINLSLQCKSSVKDGHKSSYNMYQRLGRQLPSSFYMSFHNKWLPSKPKESTIGSGEGGTHFNGNEGNGPLASRLDSQLGEEDRESKARTKPRASYITTDLIYFTEQGFNTDQGLDFQTDIRKTGYRNGYTRGKFTRYNKAARNW